MGFLNACLKKSSTEKKTPWERLRKATDSKVYTFSDIDPSKVLFYYVMSCDKDNRDLSSKIQFLL